MSATGHGVPDAEQGAAQGAGGGPRAGNAAIIGAIVLGVLAALWWFASGERELRRSAVGFAGLVAWLDENGVEARTFRNAGYLVEGEVGLRVLPLHDTNLGRDRVPPETPEELVRQTSETDLPRFVVAEKLTLLPTLLVLPKWRSGVRVLGVAHRDLLVPPDELTRLVLQIPRLRGRIARDPAGYVETEAPGIGGDGGSGGGRIGLFHPQTLSGSGCVPLVGTADAMLLGRCALPGPDEDHPDRPGHFWLLADPDLMNNHGLALAGNAGAALGFVRAVAGERPVVLDLSDFIATVDRDWLDQRHERSWDDIARLFRWPFAVVWVAFLCLAALVLWRAWVRYGPVVTGDEDETMRASREVSIDAKARLLRLADHDAALMRLHVAARLQQLAAELLGPHRPAGAEPLALLTGLVGRRAPGLAAELAAAAARLSEGPRGRAAAGELLGRLERFENCIVRIRDEFGRTSGAG